MKPLYTAHATATGGRDGRATSNDGHPDLLLKPPKEMGGPGDVEATNPEELFALGYGACFLSALSLVARQEKISAKAFSIESAVTLGQDDDGAGFGIAVELRGTLPGVEDDKAAELMRAAHHVCPYSKATRGNIDVALFVGSQAV
jgi:osmotically inducible protein OsmC